MSLRVTPLIRILPSFHRYRP